MKYSIFALFFLISACQTNSKVDNEEWMAPDHKVPPKINIEKSDIAKLKEAMPKIVVNPRYPKPALYGNVEGEVTFVFDLDTRGKVKNLRVLNSSPESVFDFWASRAILKWTFQPLVENKVKIEQKDMKYTMVFKLVP